jgi:flagellar protein FliO/FliZ
VLVIGATEEQVTLLAEVDSAAVEDALRERRPALRVSAVEPVEDAGSSAVAARSSSGALAGSVFDREGWGTFVHQVRERTVRRS